MERDISHYVHEVTTQGFVVIPDVFKADEVGRMRDVIDEIFAREEGTLAGHGPSVRFSINLTNKHAIFREMIQHPVIVEVMSRLLANDFILSSLHTRSTYPGAPTQFLHRDWLLDPRIPFPTHVNSMWMLDDFTEENGATRVVPGSHLWDGGPEANTSYPEAYAVGRAGSVAVFDSRTYHSGGANRSNGPRRGLTAFFCRSWTKPQEDHTRSVDPGLLAGASPLLLKLWGFHAQAPWEISSEPNVLKQLPAPGVPETIPA